MPPLPVLSGREARRAFERSGWRLVRQSGSHMVMTEPDTAAVLAVPDHRTVSRGTLRALIRKAGLTVDQFVELLER